MGQEKTQSIKSTKESQASPKESQASSNNKVPIDYIKYIPIIYPILVFLGYINYDFYYKRFGIDIFNYLNINEFLFSFVSLAYPLIFLLVGYLGLSIYQNLVNNINKSNDGEVKDGKVDSAKSELTTRPEKSFYNNKFDKGKEYFKKSNYKLSVANFSLGVLFFILYCLAFIVPYAILYIGYLLVISPLFDVTNFQNINVENLGYFDSPTKLISTSFWWFITFVFYVGAHYQDGKLSRKKLWFYIIATGCCLLVSNLMRYQNIRSHNFLYEKSDMYVCFIYENENIESNEDIKLLGMTSEYVFLRDIESKTNYIYKLSNVTNLEVTSLSE